MKKKSHGLQNMAVTHIVLQENSNNFQGIALSLNYKFFQCPLKCTNCTKALLMHFINLV
jgi:hypothetical protein